MTETPEIRDDLTIVELDGEAVVFDERSGNLHHLNNTAAVIFFMLDGSTTKASLAAEIAEMFGLTASEVGGQVAEIVHSFADQGLLIEPKR